MLRMLLRGNGRRLVFNPCQTFSSDASPTITTTSSPADASPSIGNFKTSETNPNNFTERHQGRFYSLSKELYDKLYEHPRHHGFPVPYREQCKTFREQCLLIRKQYLDIKRCVDAVDLTKPVVRFALYGEEGSGKSMMLACLVHYGHVNDFIILHFPWIPLFTKFCKEIVVSSIRPGFFDHTVDAVTWLTKFKLMNSERVQKLNLTTDKDYQWTKREVTPAGSSIMDIVEHGISRPAHASECMTVLFQEIKEKSSQQKCKSMVLADGINALYNAWPEYILNPTKKKEPVPTDQLTAIVAIKELVKADWSGGVVIANLDILAANKQIRGESVLPRHLLLKEGWDAFDPFIPVHVGKYTSQEVQTTIDYYLERKWLGHPKAGTEEGRLELEYLSAKNPEYLMRLCNSR